MGRGLKVLFLVLLVSTVSSCSEKPVEKPEVPETSLYRPPAVDRSYWPTHEWLTKSPEEVGLDPAALGRMEAYAFPPAGSEVDPHTDGVVIIKDGYLVYEKYAGVYGPHVRHIIWSASKSVTNAMYGVAVNRSLLKLSDPAYKYYPPLDRPQAREITLDDLLRMSSGLYTNEGFESSPFGSTVNTMLFSLGSKDMGAYAASQKITAKPGTHWEYSSPTSVLLMAILRNTMSADEYASFPWTGLFDRIGMRSAVWERDGAGTFVGSSYVYLTPRDMARFGYLFLNDGVWDGEQILPEDWVRYSTSVAPAMGTTELREDEIEEGSYGAQWWLNKAMPEWGIPSPFPDPPEDMFYASGHWGQAIFVIPSLDMVIVIVADDRDAVCDWNLFLKKILEGVRK